MMAQPMFDDCQNDTSHISGPFLPPVVFEETNFLGPSWVKPREVVNGLKTNFFWFLGFWEVYLIIKL